MNDENMERLKALLGPEFSPEELERVLQEFPELLSSPGALEKALSTLQDAEIPPLRRDFTQRVMGRLRPPSVWQRYFGGGPFPARIAIGTALTAVLLLGFYLGHRWERGDRMAGDSPPLPSADAPAQKIYQVRFSLKRPGADEVKILGDFTQWSEMVLKKDSEGNFTGELKLPEGTYAYGFLVDGKEWVADPTGHGLVPDGFGRTNSILNL